MDNGKLILAASMAFLVPLVVVAFMNKDTIADQFKTDPSVGRVLYFYSPG